MAPFIDLKGQRYGRLVLTRRATVTVPSGRALVAWRAKCDCGNSTVALACHIRSGRTKSCGCLSREMTSARRKDHGGSEWPEYNSWRAMIGRCHDKNVPSYQHYGARGISVCDAWRFGENGKTGFRCFIEDMGRRPDGLTLDRIDNDGNYEPSNCRWTTYSEQNRNQRPRKRRAA